MNRFRNQIAEPDPFTAFCNAAAFGCVAVTNDNAFLILRSSGRPSPAHLGAARNGRAPFFVARPGRPGKFFRGERLRQHSSASFNRIQGYGEGFLECRKSLLEKEKIRRPT